jgi:hypothetical protein
MLSVKHIGLHAPPATPDELRDGVFYENADAYKASRAAA